MASATSARPMPVLPAVPSTMVPPGSRPLASRVLDDEQSRAILHRLTGIDEFALPKMLQPVSSEVRQVDHWRIADGREDRGLNAGGVGGKNHRAATAVSFVSP